MDEPFSAQPNNGPIKGRGSVSNPTGRYEPTVRHAVDDGWDLEEDLPPLRTTVTADSTRKIIARNTSPDVGFEQSINPYRGCEHGCIYCYARPRHAYRGLSPGLDFETKLFHKPNAATLLENELRKPTYECKTIVIGADTDPYQPIEKTYAITRQVLEVLSAFNHPVGIITKSHMVTRDLDILGSMAARGLATVAVSVTSLDRHLARIMEPRASTPPKRLAAIRKLSDAGVPVRVMAAPMIPHLNDAELESILDAAHTAGARFAAYTLVRLPLELKELFEEWLDTHFPDKKNHVLNQLRETRYGQLYVAEFGKRMRGTGVYADLLRERFIKACRRLGLNKNRHADIKQARFCPPPRPGDQLKLL
ncbi:MAG: PA0069 family radical SAM protein [Rhodospirillales bacterium]